LVNNLLLGTNNPPNRIRCRRDKSQPPRRTVKVLLNRRIHSSNNYPNAHQWVKDRTNSLLASKGRLNKDLLSKGLLGKYTRNMGILLPNSGLLSSSTGNMGSLRGKDRLDNITVRDNRKPMDSTEEHLATEGLHHNNSKTEVPQALSFPRASKKARLQSRQLLDLPGRAWLGLEVKRVN
jgi:hypothetical protein